MSQKTYGEFLEAMKARTNANAKLEIKLRIKAQQREPEQWQRLLKSPLTKEIVLGFASAIGDDLCRAMFETSDQYRYNDLSADLQAFQEDVQLMAYEFGIALQSTEVRMPLSPSEALVRAGVLKVVQKDGQEGE